MDTEPSTPWRNEPDVPLFDADAIPNAGDPRSVGELLRDIDHQARHLLADVSGDEVARLLRSWPDVVEAATHFWVALPGRPRDAALQADFDRPMSRLLALSDGIASNLRKEGWPGDGPTDGRTELMIKTLARATTLVQRYGAEITPEQAAVRHDIDAARTRLMHGIYVTAHAVGVGLHEHGRDRREAAVANGQRVPLSQTRSPYVDATTGRWLHRMEASERAAGDYVCPRFPRSLFGAVVSDKEDPTRLARALATWDIQVHRSLAAHPTATNIVHAARIQALTIDSTLRLVRSAELRGWEPPDGLVPGLDNAGRAWASLAGRWQDLSRPTVEQLDPLLALTSSELAAAYAELTHDSTGVVTQQQTSVHPGLGAAIVGSIEMLGFATELAYVLEDAANNPDLTGPARALSRRAHNDVERAVAARERPDIDTVWVTPEDILANRVLPLPAPVAEGLILASRHAVFRSAVASSVLKVSQDAESAGPPVPGEEAAPSPHISPGPSQSPGSVPSLGGFEA